MKQEEVTFQNGDVTLSGDLLLPAGPGPFPVFIWCHGSGPATREWAMCTKSFVKSGYALLTWDKPGVGKSSGLSYLQSLTTRAHEVLAAVEMLMKRNDIETNRISFCGISQAGYVLPRVIKAFPKAEKLVLIGPGSWSFGEERAYQKQALPMKKICANAGIAEPQVIDEIALLYEKVERAPDADFCEALVRFCEEAEGKAWCQKLRMVVPPPPETPRELSDFKRLIHEGSCFDAVQEYARIPCPTLIMFGENDECVDPKVGIRNIRAGFEKSGNSQLTVNVYSGAGHCLNGAGDQPAQDIEAWLTAIARGASSVRARKEQMEPSNLPYDEVDVVFPSGPNSIAGTLAVPKGKERFPVVVFLQGSDRSTRDGFKTYAPILANARIASLRFDSPGTGKSSGKFDQDFTDRTRDALAAVSFLMNRQEINPKGIGLWGFSQGGWIVQMSASETSNVAFGIMSSGPGVSVLEQVKYQVLNDCKHAKLDETSIEQAGLMLDIMTEASLLYVSHGDPELIRKMRALHGSDMPGIDLPFALRKVSKWQDHEMWNALLQKLNSGDQVQLMDGLDVAFKKWDGEGQAWLQMLYGKQYGRCCYSFSKLGSSSGFDDYVGLTSPQLYLKKIKCPLLAYFGKSDPICPVENDVRTYQASLQEAGNPDFTLKIFPGGHCPFDKEVESFVVNWILERFKAK